MTTAIKTASDREREAFEAHIRSAWKVPESYLDWALKMTDRGLYLDSRAADQWSGWQARASLPSLPEGEPELPPLPEARIESYQIDSTMRTTTLHTYHAEDMRDYGRQCAALAAGRAEPEKSEPVVWALRFPDDSRLNLSTVFDTKTEAEQWATKCGHSPCIVVPLYDAAPSQPVGSALTDLTRAAMERAGFTYQPTAFAQALIDEICARIKAADDKAMEGDYMLDSNDCISVIRGTWGIAALTPEPAAPKEPK